MTDTQTVRLALIGAGRIGTNHARLVSHQVKGADLVGVVDPTSNAQSLAEELGAEAFSKPLDVLSRKDIDGVIIATPARTHTDLVVQAVTAGKHVFVEKPMAVTLEDANRATDAASSANKVLQVGFNRRFAAGFASARARIDAGDIGSPQLLRSLTRDPGPFTADPKKVPQWTIFLETLIHDFDTLCFLNPGAEPVEVTAHADCLAVPGAKDTGFLDTAVVTVRFDNGALGTAEASFSALYGYDVRGEAFGSQGMVTAGDVRSSDMLFYGKHGMAADTARADTDLLSDAYKAEFQAFVDSIRHSTSSPVPGEAARTALLIALGAIRSVETGATVKLANIVREDTN